MSEAAAVVDAQIEAYQARDVDRYLTHFADDAAVVLFDGTAMMPDKQVMREMYGRLFADSPDLQVKVVNRIAVGDFVVDEEHLSDFHFEGMPTEMTSVAIYRVADGKITKMLLLL
jgi:putative hydrolase of HD superfamily